MFKLEKVALLTKYLPCVNSHPLQNPYLLPVQLYIGISSEAIIQFLNMLYSCLLIEATFPSFTLLVMAASQRFWRKNLIM